jgi:hypothetical protein
MDKTDPPTHTKRREAKRSPVVIFFRAVSCVFVDHLDLRRDRLCRLMVA